MQSKEIKSYTIELERMEFRAYHGCYELERTVGNRFTVDLAVEVATQGPYGAIMQSDRVEEGVSYLTIYEIVQQQMQRTQHTVEVVVQNIIGAIRSAYPEPEGLLTVRCKVAKLAPPLGGKVTAASVTLVG